MKHLASPEFWACLEKLPANVQQLARENYELLKSNPYHPSPLQAGWPFLVGSGRALVSRVGGRCPGQHRVVLDRHACGIRPAGGLSLVLESWPNMPPVRQAEPPSAHRGDQLHSNLQRFGGPISVAEQERALMSELGATASGSQVSFPSRRHRGRAGRAVLLPNMPFQRPRVARFARRGSPLNAGPLGRTRNGSRA